MTIARVALSAVATGASGATTTGVDTTGSNLLVVPVASYSTGATVTDNKGNTYTPLTQYGGGGSLSQIWYCLSPVVGTGHTVTVGSSSTYSGLCLVGYSGVAALDTSTGSFGAAPGSITPAGANELFVAVAATGSGGADITGCSGLTLVAHAAYSGGVNTAFGFAEIIATNSAAQNPTFTSSAGTPTSAMAAFTAAAGGGGGSIILPPYLFDTMVH
jgi:hypothetical protein